MKAVIMFLKRLLGQRAWTPADWRAWSIEQAIAAGTPHHEVEWRASQFLGYVIQD